MPLINFDNPITQASDHLLAEYTVRIANADTLELPPIRWAGALELARVTSKATEYQPARTILVLNDQAEICAIYHGGICYSSQEE